MPPDPCYVKGCRGDWHGAGRVGLGLDKAGNTLVVGIHELCCYGHPRVTYFGAIDEAEMAKPHGPAVRYRPLKASGIVIPDAALVRAGGTA